MTAGGVPSRNRGAAFAAALALAALPILTVSATSRASAALPPAAAGDLERQDLARRADAGDKRAQLDLGIRYEEGRGVSPDRARAAQLYRRAASGARAQRRGPPHSNVPTFDVYFRRGRQAYASRVEQLNRVRLQ